MKEISVEELKARKEKGEQLNLIDVRETWEFEEFNIGAQNVPLSTFVNHLEELQPFKEKEVIIQCKMGGRSSQAAMILDQMGFTDVKHVKGGLDEWKAKFPV
ncbi:MAG: rhodanese-like domain-containing protein [Chitinophagales bacterium]|nr:rhodanese-like domain-containing protein [Chitinophagales bacterium]